jgi:hypothetical protein
LEFASPELLLILPSALLLESASSDPLESTSTELLLGLVLELASTEPASSGLVLELTLSGSSGLAWSGLVLGLASTEAASSGLVL